MAVFSGPNFPSSNLVFAIDGVNINSANTYSTNLLFNKIWNTGNSTTNGSVLTFYSLNGPSAENERIYDVTPAGNIDVIWSSPSNDAASNDDGGWNTERFTIDASKKYRYSVWIRKKDIIGNGRAYLGLYGFNANNTNIGVYNRTDGTTLNTNFYFMSRRFDNSDLVPAATVNEWVLFVGHVWPAGSQANTTPDSESGVWKRDGTKIAPGADCIWHPDTVRATHRSYQYYSTTTNEKQQWWDPRVDVVDGTQPSLTSLLAGFNETNQFDLRKKVKIRIPNNVKSSSSFSFSSAVGNTLNDDRERIVIDSSNVSFATEQTIIMGLRPTNFSQRRTPYNQSYWSFGTITQETNGTLIYYSGSGANTTSYSGYSGPVLANNETVVIGVTRNSNNVVWFKNGSFVSSAVNQWPTSTLLSTEDRTITIGYGFTGYGYVGDIYFMHVYDRALSNTEMMSHFEAYRGRYGL
jgi:hypothetical protein